MPALLSAAVQCTDSQQTHYTELLHAFTDTIVGRNRNNSVAGGIVSIVTRQTFNLFLILRGY